MMGVRPADRCRSEAPSLMIRFDQVFDFFFVVHIIIFLSGANLFDFDQDFRRYGRGLDYISIDIELFGSSNVIGRALIGEHDDDGVRSQLLLAD